MKEKEKTQIENKPEKSKGAKIAMKIVNIVINILIVVVLLTSILVATLALSSKANNGVPSIFGYSFHTIQSPSMEGGSDKYEGGDYYVGDLVIGKATNCNPKEVFEVGDIVVYTTQNDDTPDGVNMICHRVIEREQDDNGTFFYITKGDNSSLEDPDPHTAAEIVSVCYSHDYQGAVWKGFGNFLDYIRTPQGFFLVVLLPMIIFFLYEIVRVVMNALVYKKTKAQDQKEDAEREKQEAVDAAVKAALEAVGKGDAPAEKDAAPADEDDADAAPAEESSAKAPDLTPDQMEQFKQFLAFQEAQKAKKEEKPAESTDTPEEQ